MQCNFEARQRINTLLNEHVIMSSTQSKSLSPQQTKVLEFLRRNTSINKIEALAIGVGNIAEVIRQLRVRTSIPIWTVSTKDFTYYSL